MRFFKFLCNWLRELRKQRAWDRMCDDLRNDRAYFVVTVKVEGGTLKTFLKCGGASGGGPETRQCFIPDGIDESEIDFGDPFEVEVEDEPETCESDGVPDGESTAGAAEGNGEAGRPPDGI